MSNMPPPPPPPGGEPPPPPPPPRPDSSFGAGAVPTADFGGRLGAYVVDSLVLGVPFFIVNLIMVNAVPTEIVTCRDGTALCEQPTGAGFGILALTWLAMVGVAIWYWGTFEGVRGQSIGKRLLGIKTVRVGTNSPIGFGPAVGRLFARILSGIPCFFGYLWMIWDGDKQTWHDKIVGSQVVRA